MGFAYSLKDALNLFKDSELLKNDIYYISDDDELVKVFGEHLKNLEPKSSKKHKRLDPPAVKVINNFGDFSSEKLKKKSSILFVKLANQVTRRIEIDIKSNDIEALSQTEHATENAEFLEMLSKLNEDEETFDKTELPNEFIMWLREIFDFLKDSKLKISILRLFKIHGINDVEFISNHPIEFNFKDIEVTQHISLFDDIKIVTDQNDPNTSSKSYVRSDDFAKKACAGNSTALEAFSSNKFTVIYGKKHANIQNTLINCNHDILDSLARNGVICSPTSSSQSSMSKLVNIAKQFKQFHICFIHPAIEYKAMRCDYPTQQLEPAYLINQGEICAIAYRYFVLNFFGYCSIKNDSMLEYDYIF
jgi:hypothetical protein